jgi:hypothetical protein
MTEGGALGVLNPEIVNPITLLLKAPVTLIVLFI